MATANPYDRRRAERPTRSQQAMAAHFSSPMRVETDTDHAGLTLRDLDALVHEKVRRARLDDADTATVRWREEVVKAQRTAWQEGEQEGYEEGCRDVRAAYEAAYGQALRDLHMNAVAMLDAGDRATKAALAEIVREAAKFTDRITAAADLGNPQTARETKDIPF